MNAASAANPSARPAAGGNPTVASVAAPVASLALTNALLVWLDRGNLYEFRSEQKRKWATAAVVDLLGGKSPRHPRHFMDPHLADKLISQARARGVRGSEFDAMR